MKSGARPHNLGLFYHRFVLRPFNREQSNGSEGGKLFIDDGSKEGAGALLAGVGEELAGRALLDDDAVVHEQHPVGDLARKAHLVGDDEHGDARVGQAAHDGEDLADDFGVQGGGGLVKEHDLGLHAQGAGDGDALLLAAGEAAGVGVLLVQQPHAAQQLQRLFAGLGGLGFFDVDGAAGDVVHDAHVGKEVEGLKDHADLAADGGDVRGAAVHGDAVDDDGAAGGLLQTVEAAQEGALAGAGGADDADDLAFFHGTVDALEDLKGTEALVQVPDLNHHRFLPPARLIWSLRSE